MTASNKPIIETPRLIIRGFTPEDADDLHEILGDAKTMQNLEPAYDLEKTKAFLASFCMERKGALAAADRHTKKLIGYILFNASAPGAYELGWIFNRSYWRQGYAYEACKAVIDFAFGTLHAHKLFAETIDSVKSVGLMKKLGMLPEGVQRSQTPAPDGRWADVYLYGMLRQDWLQTEPFIPIQNRGSYME